MCVYIVETVDSVKYCEYYRSGFVWQNTGYYPIFMAISLVTSLTYLFHFYSNLSYFDTLVERHLSSVSDSNCENYAMYSSVAAIPGHRHICFGHVTWQL